MTRDKTVALFLECEEKRTEARAAASAQGKGEQDAENSAHKAAWAHWNAWAEAVLAKRKQLEASSLWAVDDDTLQPQNAETRAWMEEAKASFDRCLFLVRRDDGTMEIPRQEEKPSEFGELSVKLIVCDAPVIDFRGFIFPGTASFTSAIFEGGKVRKRHLRGRSLIQ